MGYQFPRSPPTPFSLRNVFYLLTKHTLAGLGVSNHRRPHASRLEERASQEEEKYSPSN